jgi:predicted RNA-binding Zn-ribbon protein involved in translation (DUF1610 family)
MLVMWNTRPALSHATKCRSCDWNGTIGQTIQKELRTVANAWSAVGGYDAIEYRCPKCGKVIACSRLR